MDKNPQTPASSPPEPTADAIAPANSDKTATKPAAATPPAEPKSNDVAEEPQNPEAGSPKPHHRLKAWVSSHKKQSLVLGILGLLILLAVIPWTRYQAAGLALKQNVTLKVLDSTTNTPVSGATVSAGGVSAQTDENGQATLKLKDGWRLVTISKNYYNQATAKVLVPLIHQKSVPSVALTANGRQVGVSVTNAISAQPLAAVNITVAGVSAKTDATGKATIVLPPNQTTQQATLSLAGFNDAKVSVQVSNDQIAQNSYKLVPAGRVYFLSNSSGNLDVVSTNLDGTNKKTVLPGTGSEEDFTTTIVVSPDSKYIALLANRNGSNALVYMVTASSGAVSLVDKTSATYTIYGWLGSSLIYGTESSGGKTWQAGYEQLKAYNPGTNKLTVVASGGASGNATASVYEDFSFVSLSGDGKVIFSKNWTQGNYQNDASLSGKVNTLNWVQLDSGALTTVAKYPPADTVSYSQYEPNYIYIQQPHGSATNYFNYKFGDSGASPVTITDNLFYKERPYFFYSPDGNHNLWTEVRDGKNTILVGNATGANAKTLDQDSDLQAYGWYNNDYVLLSKNKNELYIQSANGGTPLKVSSYESTNSPGATYYGGSGGRGGGGY